MNGSPSATHRFHGATDCHLHIFGSPDRYPFTKERFYTPDEASLPMYDALSSRLGLARMVIVQPSVYGMDNRCTLDMCAAAGKQRARAIVVVDDTISDSQLREMHDVGARGIRINALTPAGVPIAKMRRLAERIAPLGWHLQFWISGAQVVELADVIRKLPVPAVFDHLGQFSLDSGLENPQLETLLSLLKEEHCWVKLVAYRISKKGPPYDDVRPQAEAIIATAPTRCVWGSDWPHPHLQERPYPDAQLLLDLVAAWTHGDEAQRKRILVDNPARLYGF